MGVNNARSSPNPPVLAMYSPFNKGISANSSTPMISYNDPKTVQQRTTVLKSTNNKSKKKARFRFHYKSICDRVMERAEAQIPNNQKTLLLQKVLNLKTEIKRPTLLGTTTNLPSALTPLQSTKESTAASDFKNKSALVIETLKGNKPNNLEMKGRQLSAKIGEEYLLKKVKTNCLKENSLKRLANKRISVGKDKSQFLMVGDIIQNKQFLFKSISRSQYASGIDFSKRATCESKNNLISHLKNVDMTPRINARMPLHFVKICKEEEKITEEGAVEEKIEPLIKDIVHKAGPREGIKIVHKKTMAESVERTLKKKIKSTSIEKNKKLLLNANKGCDSAAEKKRIWKGGRGTFSKALLEDWYKHMNKD